MTMLSNIIEILVGGITGVATGVGQGLQSLVQQLFASPEGDLTLFGTLIIVFAGIALAIGLCRWVLNFVTSLGARNR